MKKILKNIFNSESMSGNETDLINLIKKNIPSTHKHKINNLGNLIVENKSESKTKNKILVLSAIDEVGLLIHKIENDGSVRFMPIGEIQTNALVGSQIKAKNLVGVIEQKPIHLQTTKEKNETPKIENLYIDFGFDSKKELENFINIGDFATFNSTFTEFGDNCVSFKSINSKLGCAILFELIEPNLNHTAFAFMVKSLVLPTSVSTIINEVKPQITVVLNSLEENLTKNNFADESNKTKNFILNVTPQTNNKLKEISLEIANSLNLNFELKVTNKLNELEKNISQSNGGTETFTISVPCLQSNSSCSSVNLNCLLNTLIFTKKFIYELENINLSS